MPTNDFLPFAADPAANVISQPDYVSLASLRANGFSSGTAKSAELNKVWRQSSTMAAVVGQLIVDLTGRDAVDDGSTTNLLAALKAAVQVQSVGVVGATRNLRCSIAAASATATVTSDEIILESVLGGLTYRLANFSKTINLAITGAGGMDAGAAPNNGYVALYAIYNPATGGSALLAVNATSAVAPETYGGANMPAGYTASALLTVVPTNGSGQFKVCYVRGRKVGIELTQVYTSNTATTGATIGVSAALPLNAVRASGEMSTGNTTPQYGGVAIRANSTTAIGQQAIAGSVDNARPLTGNFAEIPFVTPQSMYIVTSSSGGSPSFLLLISGYSI